MFHRDHYGCRRDDICTVIGIEGSRVVLAHPDGEERRFQPSGNAAWYLRICDTERIELRAGDRIRWTRNHKVPPRSFAQTGAPDLVNGGEAEIVEIDYSRVRFRDGEGFEFNLALTDPQLRHLDHAYCSTVHAAQGRTARAAIAVLDAGSAADRQLFHVELSRVSDRFLLLTDDREALIELLESRPVMEDGALEALGVDPAAIPAVDLEVFAALAEDWKALRQQAEETETIPFFLPGYGGVMARAAALSTIEDLPVDMRRLTDTMLAEHEGHLARDREVRNLTERIQENWRRWPELGWAAQARGCAVEELPRYDAWREEGTALLEEARGSLEADGHAGRHLHAMPGGSRRSGGRGRDARTDAPARRGDPRVRGAASGGERAGPGGGHDPVLCPGSRRPPRAGPSARSLAAPARAPCSRGREDHRRCQGLREPAHGDRSASRKDGTASRRALGAGEPCRRRAPQGARGLRRLVEPLPRRRSATGRACSATRTRGGPISTGSKRKRRPLRPPSTGFAKLRGHDLFDASMKGIEEAAQAARGRGILPFHDDAYCKAIDEAKRLAGKHELDEEARRRLQAVLEEQAARAAEWMVVVKLLRDIGSLERRRMPT